MAVLVEEVETGKVAVLVAVIVADSMLSPRVSLLVGAGRKSKVSVSTRTGRAKALTMGR
jgi:hypothetical protein